MMSESILIKYLSSNKRTTQGFQRVDSIKVFSSFSTHLIRQGTFKSSYSTKMGGVKVIAHVWENTCSLEVRRLQQIKN